MFVTAIHAPVPAAAMKSLMVPLHEASCILKRGVQDGGKPFDRAHMLKVYEAAMSQLNDIEDSVMDLNNDELSTLLIELDTVQNIADTVKTLSELVLKAIKLKPSASKAEEATETVAVFHTFHGRLTEIVDVVRVLATTPDPDENSPEFAAFLVSLGAMVAKA